MLSKMRGRMLVSDMPWENHDVYYRTLKEIQVQDDNSGVVNSGVVNGIMVNGVMVNSGS